MANRLKSFFDSNKLSYRLYTLIDRFLGSDPGFIRLRNALLAVVTILVIIIAELLFVHLTHALQIVLPLHSVSVPKIVSANHEFLIIAVMVGSIIGMISAFGVSDRTAKGQLVTMVLLPLAMIPALLYGIAVGDHRIISLISFAVIITVATYLRRFGPRGFIIGMILFMGDFIGFFIHTAIKATDLGWLIAEIGLGLIVAIIIRFVFFYPRQDHALERMKRSYNSRARQVVILALQLFDNQNKSEKVEQKLDRKILSLNESALMIDAQLGAPNAVKDGSSLQLLQQNLFDVELAITNVARFTVALIHSDLLDQYINDIRLSLLSIIDKDFGGAKIHANNLINLLDKAGPASGEKRGTTLIVLHRFAGSLFDLVEGMKNFTDANPSIEKESAFEPSVVLQAGWLPGSTKPSAVASTENSKIPEKHITLTLYNRTTIQMGVAIGLAIILGDLLSGARFYWAVLAVFMVFTGVNNSQEQIRKALGRVFGTAIGIAVGSLLVNIVGHSTIWSVAIILTSLFLGFYLMRINAAFFAIAITVVVSQLYVQLDVFTNHLLLLRLEETILGSAIAIVVVLLVLPLRTNKAMRTALLDYIQSVENLVGTASRLLVDKNLKDTLRADARKIDVSYQALVATAQPLRRNLLGVLDEYTAQLMRSALASRNYSRDLVADVESSESLDSKSQADVKLASKTFDKSLAGIASSLNGVKNVTYTRSSSLFDQAQLRLESNSTIDNGGQLAIRDFKLIDNAMANMTEIMGLKTVNLDTV